MKRSQKVVLALSLLVVGLFVGGVAVAQGPFLSLSTMSLTGGQLTDIQNAALQVMYNVGLINASKTIPGAAFASNALVGPNAAQVYHGTYSFAVDGGVIGLITPVSTIVLPAKFVITGCAINPSTALTGATATISAGLSAGGGSAASFIAATAVASWTINAQMQCVPVPQTASTWIKLTAPASVTITVATAALTAGVIEFDVFGYLAAS